MSSAMPASPCWRPMPACSCALNVFINAKSIKDRDFAETQLAEVNALLAKAAAETEAIYEVVRGKIG